ncbi:UNKNOWN [Stylonychia lemnae]|uniref:PCI domain-containing protein n=1 Tax=Stylonychia lemnae TaxID=5949 RepID=A0A077ZSW6_STYLE|nr:UNKNOWN [Stylonychia lemnae]|eukprot:CDW72405.1 UNKNOWN [Stylonychia lemnae]
MTSTTESHIAQIKRLAPYLDSHILLQFLKNHVPNSDKLQEQLTNSLLISQKEKVQQLEEDAKNEASKLLTLLNNHQEFQKLRSDREFTLEKLQEDKGIQLQDCKKLFAYAKLQYEAGEYKSAEKYLFHLKEILTQEQQTQIEFVLQVFWGLLSSEILLQREKQTVENTTLRKLKEFIEKLQQEQVHSYQESMSHKAWLLHQILVYSFSNNYTDLFADILTNRAVYGTVFLNIIQIKSQYLLRYLVASLLLKREVDELLETALPIILQEKDQYSDVFTEFIEALYEDFDFDRAQSLVQKIAEEAQNDLLLKNFATQLQNQAGLLVYEVKSQIYKSVDLSQLAADTGKDHTEALHLLEENMKEEGFSVDVTPDQKTFTLVGQLADTKGRIEMKTNLMVQRTIQLNEHYQKQLQFLKTQQNLQALDGFVTGLTLPHFLSENVYMTLATCFLRPHLKFKEYLDNKPEDMALSTQVLDQYVKDTLTSFLKFFVIIGPVIYYTHIKKEEVQLLEKDKDNVPIMTTKDKYSQILIKMKEKELSEAGEHLASEKKQISFQDYEKFIEQLEKEKKFQVLERNNPDSLLYGKEKGEELQQLKHAKEL